MNSFKELSELYCNRERINVPPSDDMKKEVLQEYIARIHKAMDEALILGHMNQRKQGKSNLNELYGKFGDPSKSESNINPCSEVFLHGWTETCVLSTNLNLNKSDAIEVEFEDEIVRPVV